MARPPATGRAARGVSLVEALVALAVMAFGMLAVAGIQGMLRLNSDVAKQRSEAVRIAQEQIEQLRAFAVRSADTGVPAGTRSWSDIDTGPGTTLSTGRSMVVGASIPPSFSQSHPSRQTTSANPVSRPVAQKSPLGPFCGRPQRYECQNRPSCPSTYWPCPIRWIGFSGLNRAVITCFAGCVSYGPRMSRDRARVTAWSYPVPPSAVVR